MPKQTATANPSPSPSPRGIEVDSLASRIAELTQETLDHPQVVNKTDEAVASRVARMLNREKQFSCPSHRFWTGAHVLGWFAKHSK